jgi:hypothetical protein
MGAKDIEEGKAATGDGEPKTKEEAGGKRRDECLVDRVAVQRRGHPLRDQYRTSLF